MNPSSIFSTITNLFIQLQLITGLSPLSLILFMLATWKSAKAAWSNNSSIAGVVAETIFYMLIWWLVGYLLLNPIWNLILGRL